MHEKFMHVDGWLGGCPGGFRASHGVGAAYHEAAQYDRVSRYYGHQEVITGIAKLHNPKGYASCSWDTTLMIWNHHTVDDALARQHQKHLKCHEDFLNPRAGRHVSEFEKKYPKFIPNSLNVRLHCLTCLQMLEDV
jgi:hypothetical protein